MLRSIKEMMGYSLLASDDKFGVTRDMLFDDKSWIIRYLVADTGKWLAGRKIIIPTGQLETPNWTERIFPVDLTRKQIEESPSLSSDEPVSRQHERNIYSFYGWSPYWTSEIPDAVAVEQMIAEEAKGNPHLRSCEEVDGYHIHAADGEIGHVDDFIVDDKSWKIRYLIADTRNWLPGKKVLVSVQWISRISWTENDVFVDVDKDSIKNSPKYDPSEPVNREYEERLYDFYGRPRYWV